MDADVYEGFKGENAAIVSRCMNTDSTNINNCTHPVSRDCSRLRDKCIQEYNESGLLGDDMAKKMCAANHKACCQTLRNINLSSKFALDGPSNGVVIPKNDNGNDNNDNTGWQCDISKEVKSLSECKRRCLEDPRCKILDSNMALFNKRDRAFSLSKMPAAKCVMYDDVGYKIVNGNNNKINGINSNRKNKGNRRSVNNIWTRRELDIGDVI